MSVVIDREEIGYQQGFLDIQSNLICVCVCVRRDFQMMKGLKTKTETFHD